MGSTRLPGKVLQPVAGRPLIDHLLGRLTRAIGRDGPLDLVVLATSDREIDDPLARHVAHVWPDVPCVRGPEEDVLQRFLKVVAAYPSRHVVRITGDCPLINLEALATFVSSHRRAAADVTNYAPGYEYVDKGLEVVSATALARAAADPQLTVSDREHVTTLLYRKPERYRVNYVESKPYLRRADIRLTVDTRTDLEFMSVLLGRLGNAVDTVSLAEIVELLDADPRLRSLNSRVGRKSTAHERVRVGFRCDGDVKTGFGHVVGSLRLGHLLARELGVGVEFVVRDDPRVVERISREGFEVEVLDPDIDPEADIARLLEKIVNSGWSAVVINFSKRYLEQYERPLSGIRGGPAALTFLDNPLPPTCEWADLLINPLPHLAYDGYSAEGSDRLDGLEYFLVQDALEKYHGRSRDRSGPVENVVVAMGGSDPGNLTATVLGGLALAGFRGNVEVVLGPLNPHQDTVVELFRDLRLRGRVERNPLNFFGRLWAADVGFSALGLTTYEMAFLGVPVLLLTDDDLNTQVARVYTARYETARVVEPPGAGPEGVAEAFTRLAEDAAARAEMTKNGRRRVAARAGEVTRAYQRLLFSVGIEG